MEAILRRLASRPVILGGVLVLGMLEFVALRRSQRLALEAETVA